MGPRGDGLEAFRRIDRVITLFERVWMVIAALMLFAIMMVSTIDVGLRYAFNSPLVWSYDLISLFLMCGVFFFSLSDTLRNNEHVSVDLIHGSVSDRTRHAMLLLGYSLAAVVFCAMVWASSSRLAVSYSNDEVVAGSVAWPTWIAAMFVTLGLTLTMIRILFRACGHFMSVVTGRSFIPLPPVSGVIEAI